MYVCLLYVSVQERVCVRDYKCIFAFLSSVVSFNHVVHSSISILIH